jgi:hypothetical protein
MKWMWTVLVALGCRGEPRARSPAADGPTVSNTVDGGTVGGVTGRGAAPDAAFVPDAASPPDAAPSACGGASPVKRYDVGDRGKTITLKVGQTFAVELSAARHRYFWGPAELSGSSVEAVGRDVVGPPDDVDGGSNDITYTFCAKGKGTTKLSIPSGGDVPPEAFTLTIKVR